MNFHLLISCGVVRLDVRWLTLCRKLDFLRLTEWPVPKGKYTSKEWEVRARVSVRLCARDTHARDLRERLLEVYRENISRSTQPFPGISELLDSIEQRGLNWGIVTNKPGWLTEPLLQDLDLFNRAACVVSGDTLDERKPHPAPMLHASRLANSRPEQCVYIGDAQRDIEAGNNAGMQTLVALFGYLQEEDEPHTWNANSMIEQPQDLLAWMDSR